MKRGVISSNSPFMQTCQKKKKIKGVEGDGLKNLGYCKKPYINGAQSLGFMSSSTGLLELNGPR
jgi:hypothetical protein